jgi:hypothetical protein
MGKAGQVGPDVMSEPHAVSQLTRKLERAVTGKR